MFKSKKISIITVVILTLCMTFISFFISGACAKYKSACNFNMVQGATHERYCNSADNFCNLAVVINPIEYLAQKIDLGWWTMQLTPIFYLFIFSLAIYFIHKKLK